MSVARSRSEVTTRFACTEDGMSGVRCHDADGTEPSAFTTIRPPNRKAVPALRQRQAGHFTIGTDKSAPASNHRPAAIL